jgi:hypothetical protein
VNVSCGDSILVESILRENDQQKGFHAAKTQLGHSANNFAVMHNSVLTQQCGNVRPLA